MEYDQSYLESLSLPSLREIGKGIGVKAPTGLTKKELINAILDVNENRIEPYFSKLGRPSLNTLEKNGFVKVTNLIPVKQIVDERFEQVLDQYLLKVKNELMDIYNNIK